MTTKIRRVTVEDRIAEMDFHLVDLKPFECQCECRCPWLAAYPNDLCGDCDGGRHKIWGTNFPDWQRAAVRSGRGYPPLTDEEEALLADSPAPGAAK